MSSNKTNYVSIKQLAARYPLFTESAIRNLIWRSDKNGLDKHICRIGRKVAIDDGDNGFSFWINSHKSEGTNHE